MAGRAGAVNAVPDVRSKKVLVFGDSLSAGQFSPGAVMGQHLTGADVRVNARVGRSAYNFWSREDTQRQLEEVKRWDPDIVIIVLGTNDIGLSMAKDGPKMRELAQHLRSGGADVWAFGPPSFPTQTKQHQGSSPVVQMMKDVFGPHFLDLRPLTNDLLSAKHRTIAADGGVHFTAAGGKLAGERMAERVIGAGGGSDLGMVGIALVVAAFGWFVLR